MIKNIYDNISSKDNYELSKRGFYKTMITVQSREKDNTISIRNIENVTALMGRIQLIETSFDVPIDKNKHLFLNDNVTGVVTPTPTNPVYTCPGKQYLLDDRRPYSDKEIFKRRRVKYFCVGNGAENKTVQYATWPAHDTDVKLFNMIPFRLIEGQKLPEAEKYKYKFEVLVTINGIEYYAYYFKRIEFLNDDGVLLTVDGSPHIPKWSDTIPDLNSDPNNSYANGKNEQTALEFALNIDNTEFVEYFNAVDNTLNNARISEIGLISGLECNPTLGIGVNGSGIVTDSSSDSEKQTSEVWDASLFSHLSLESTMAVARDNTQIDLLYKVFV